tara:strand:- start:235 stop:390 length:156 start_codon:yes stop_codon:yes gene_type:complete
MFVDCLLAEIKNKTNYYASIEVTIKEFEMTIMFDDNPFSQTTIHFTPLQYT